MKFMLKDGLIHIVENHGLPNNTIEGSVEAPGLDGFSLSYSINGKPFKAVGSKIIVPKEDLKKTSLHLSVRAAKVTYCFCVRSNHIKRCQVQVVVICKNN